MRNDTTIMDPLMKVCSKLNEIGTAPKDFGTGELLYTSEIHTIVAIGKNPGISLTEIADILGVSKSAVSKFVKNLLSKDYINKNKAINNNRQVMFHLTSKGETAFAEHEIFKSTLFKDVNNIIATTSSEELELIENFLDSVYEALSLHTK